MELEEAITRLTRDISRPLACGDLTIVEINDLEIALQELEKYKRLAEINLKDSEEFKNNICEHRCVLKSELQELEENSIPKKRVEDEIKELELELELRHFKREAEIQIRLLQKLLKKR